jgi:hypothetical protein
MRSRQQNSTEALMRILIKRCATRYSSEPVSYEGGSVPNEIVIRVVVS